LVPPVRRPDEIMSGNNTEHDPIREPIAHVLDLLDSEGCADLTNLSDVHGRTVGCNQLK
jgi:hypothetical protein